MADDVAGDFVDAADPELVRRGPGGLAYYRGKPLHGSVFDVSGEMSEISSFDHGVVRSESFTHGNGQRAEERAYVAGHPFGEWRRWYPDGVLAQREVYTLTGRLRRRTRWSATGTLQEDTDVERREKGVDPDAVTYGDPRLTSYQDGSRWFVDGEPWHGQVIDRDGDAPDGAILAVRTYADGYASGPTRSWFSEGGRRGVGFTWRNRPVGLFLEWSVDGGLVREESFDAGSEPLLKREWESPGIPAAGWRAPRADAIRWEARPDGAPKRLGVWGPSGPVGAWVSFAPGGQVVGEDYFSPAGRLLVTLRWDEAGDRAL